MGGVQIEEHLDQLRAEGLRLAAAARRADLDTGVPGCPGWKVRDLVKHVGGVHRWAAAIVGGALPDGDDVTGDLVGTGPADSLLIDWFSDGHRALVQTLRTAPGDPACFTFLPRSLAAGLLGTAAGTRDSYPPRRRRGRCAPSGRWLRSQARPGRHRRDAHRVRRTAEDNGAGDAAHRACGRPVLACHARPARFGSGELPAPGRARRCHCQRQRNRHLPLGVEPAGDGLGHGCNSSR